MQWTYRRQTILGSLHRMILPWYGHPAGVLAMLVSRATYSLVNVGREPFNYYQKSFNHTGIGQ